ncbi:MAG: hypothetical protein M1814_004062 [Vezdaea aestivalis]|nr:MAG: hypothetical protein M1814_004062 [Vezdaea aestivalis]
MPSVLANAPALPRHTGLVVSAGLMAKTVKVRVTRRVWDKKVRKYYFEPESILTHDPKSSLRAGDVVEIQPGWRASKMVRHVVTKLVVPFGGDEGRTQVLGREELEEEWRGGLERKRARKGKIVFKREIEIQQGGAKTMDRVVRVGVERAIREWEEKNGEWVGKLPGGLRRREDGLVVLDAIARAKELEEIAKTKIPDMKLSPGAAKKAAERAAREKRVKEKAEVKARLQGKTEVHGEQSTIGTNILAEVEDSQSPIPESKSVDRAQVENSPSPEVTKKAQGPKQSEVKEEQSGWLGGIFGGGKK